MYVKRDESNKIIAYANIAVPVCCDTDLPEEGWIECNDQDEVNAFLYKIED